MLRKKLIVFFGALYFAAGFISCALADDKTSLVYTDPDKTIMLSQKTPQFTISLTSNPTTGYSWFLADYNPQFIRAIHHVYHAPVSQIAGAQGKEEWVFALNPLSFSAPHIIQIKLLYARPWNLNDGGKQAIFTVVTQ